MPLAFTVALSSIAAGALLGLARDDWGRGVHTLHLIAIGAAAFVALGHLLPDAYAGGGLPAVFLFAVTAVGPSTIRAASRGQLGFELGYAALALHKVGDGLGLAAYSDAGAVDVVLAIGLHSIPLTALMVMIFADRRGPRSGVLRAIGLACAASLGIGAIGLAPPDLFANARPWLDAVVGGLLLHAVLHSRHGPRV